MIASIGLLVRLNSGGPVMTVVDIDPYSDFVVCSWRSGNIYESLFHCHSLTLVRNE